MDVVVSLIVLDSQKGDIHIIGSPRHCHMSDKVSRV
jgi:hypothetical protein